MERVRKYPPLPSWPDGSVAWSKRALAYASGTRTVRWSAAHSPAKPWPSAQVTPLRKRPAFAFASIPASGPRCVEATTCAPGDRVCTWLGLGSGLGLGLGLGRLGLGWLGSGLGSGLGLGLGLGLGFDLLRMVPGDVARRQRSGDLGHAPWLGLG